MSRRFLRQTVSLGVSYTLGTFNDNFFKQAILLLVVSMGPYGRAGLGHRAFFCCLSSCSPPARGWL